MIERNEEVCIFYERINVQGIDLFTHILNRWALFLYSELVVRKADIELKSREEEIRFLKMEV